MSKHRIDSHKLKLHPHRVAQWLNGENIYPVYIEISPSGACNHRCKFCGMDYLGYQNRRIDTAVLIERLAEMGKLGVKAVMFAGEGEPLLHKDICEISKAAKSSGIDIAFTTNAVLLNEETAAQLLPITSWIKISCNAGTAKTYSDIHRTKESDFEIVIDNAKRAVQLRRELGADCTVGFQILLLPENMHEVPELASRVRDIGADYLVIKPYSRGPNALHDDYAELTYGDCAPLADALSAFNSGDFHVIFRREAMQRRENIEHNYKRCLSLPFWAYIDSGGNVWGCLRRIGEERFSYGSIMEQRFESLWNAPERLENVSWCESTLDIEDCHVDCRMDAINEYLWELKHPGPHVNFI